jgi:hypothetical protein
MTFRKQTEIKKLTPKKNHHWVIKSMLTFLVTFILAFFLYGVFQFFTTYGFRSPVIIQNPIYRLNPSIIISPLNKTKKTSAVFDVGKIADYIYMKESSSGKNDSCRDLGLYNGYGYRQNSFEWICYNSHEEARQHVIDWLTQNIKNGNIEQALCKYNMGIDTQNCSYAINYQ